MKENTVVFTKAKCNKSGQDYYIRYDRTVKGFWVETRGETSLPPSSSASSSSGATVDMSKLFDGPQAGCPHCGAKDYYRCGQCGTVNCWNSEDGTKVRCVNCGREGDLDNAGSFTNMTGKGGQGQ